LAVTLQDIRDIAVQRRRRARIANPVVTPSQHIDSLDGIRGIAICFVAAFHFALWATPQSALDRFVLDVSRGLWTGVDLFFVLSGFLITGILLDSRGDEHYFRNFYARRTLRIFPLYYGVLVAVLIVLPLAVPRVRQTDMFATLHANQAWFWTYLTNVRVAAVDSWDPTVPGRLNHFWSLALEEQFYLIWPLIVLVSGPRRLLKACGVIVGVALVTRALLLFVDRPVAGFSYTAHLAGYVLLPARADSLAIGAAIACLLRAKNGYEVLRHLARPLAVVSGIVVLAIFVADRQFDEYDVAVQVVGYPMVAILFAAVIVLAIDPQRGWVRRVCEQRALRRIGVYAYAIYIFHFPMAYGIASAGYAPDHFFPRLHTIVPGLIVFSTITFAATFALAAISWRFYEAPILGLKRFFISRNSSSASDASSAAPAPGLPVTAG
jgi:peptidoglycan/LPS O-acetylase OafA/YrhL